MLPLEDSERFAARREHVVRCDLIGVQSPCNALRGGSRGDPLIAVAIRLGRGLFERGRSFRRSAGDPELDGELPEKLRAPRPRRQQRDGSLQ
jgi:hypothetical protein